MPVPEPTGCLLLQQSGRFRCNYRYALRSILGVRQRCLNGKLQKSYDWPIGPLLQEFHFDAQPWDSQGRRKQSGHRTVYQSHEHGCVECGTDYDAARRRRSVRKDDYIRDQTNVPGVQNVTFYAVNAMGGRAGASTLASAAKYGGFNDKNRDNTSNFNPTSTTGQTCVYPTGSSLDPGQEDPTTVMQSGTEIEIVSRTRTSVPRRGET